MNKYEPIKLEPIVRNGIVRVQYSYNFKDQEQTRQLSRWRRCATWGCTGKDKEGRFYRDIDLANAVIRKFWAKEANRVVRKGGA